jgi:hypothetical protein
VDGEHISIFAVIFSSLGSKARNGATCFHVLQYFVKSGLQPVSHISITLPDHQVFFWFKLIFPSLFFFLMNSFSLGFHTNNSLPQLDLCAERCEIEIKGLVSFLEVLETNLFPKIPTTQVLVEFSSVRL